MRKYNLSKIMKRAWELVKEARMNISSALKKSWKEAKNLVTEIKNVVVRHYESYNRRRYSAPWVCLMTERGKYDFSVEVGTYTGSSGSDGDLIVYAPVVGQVYGYGQKDYRGNGTEINYIKWSGTEFVKCDKIGNPKEEENESNCKRKN